MTKKQIISQLELAGYKIFNFKKLINIYSYIVIIILWK